MQSVIMAASGDEHETAKEYVLDQLHLRIDGASVKLEVMSSYDDSLQILEGKLGCALSKDLQSPTQSSSSPLSLQWSDGTKLSVSKDGNSYEVQWWTQSHRLEDNFDICKNPWYGGGEVYNQHWLIQSSPKPETPYVTGDFGANPGGYGGVAESYWLSSTGAALYVPEYIPLFVSVNADNSNLLVLASQHREPYKTNDPQCLRLKYYIITGTDVKATHLYAVTKFLGKPEAVIDERVVRHPIWSTWARYKAHINEEKVLSFANEIQSHNFSYSHLEIDDKWEPCYGIFKFDTSKFPNTGGMIRQLHDKGFRVTLWVYPFINTDCSHFKEASDKGYLVKTPEGETGITSWWNGAQAGAIDFTNSDAVKWYTVMLQQLCKDTGLDGYKFDAGETHWLPKRYLLNTTLELQPDSYSTMYVEAVSKFGTFSEVRTGRRTQKLAVMMRMLDKDSKWGYDNGLKSLVTTLLQFNIVGYPFVLPDMIGGNGYAGIPSRELFIRWIQANTFMPVIQYSYVPWDYDDEVVQIARRFTVLHSQYADKIMELAAKAVADGTPINLPVWWVDPSDEEAQRIESEYLLGEDLLAAPVMDEGATSRDIYLPKGKWRDELNPNHPIIVGKVWLKNYPVPLQDLAYFTKVD